LILYEHPFNESIRTMLRLEHLFKRLGELMSRESALDHHFALATLFEVLDVAARADLKSEVLKELERHRAQMQSFRGHPGISEAVLDDVVERIERAFAGLNGMQGKAGQALATHEWLTGIRSRISIPAGTCAFDLPGYYAWQHFSAQRRQNDLRKWATTLVPLAEAVGVLLNLLRDNGVPQRVAAPGGQYQQRLPEGKTYHLLRLRIDESLGLVPEISGHRLMVSVRLMRPDEEGRLKPVAEDASFEMALCA
jgi:cell division protein ZapD